MPFMFKVCFLSSSTTTSVQLSTIIAAFIVQQSLGGREEKADLEEQG